MSQETGKYPTPHPQLGAIDPTPVSSPVVACDGGKGALGHPRVWLRIRERQIFCPYCSRLYVLEETGQATTTGH